MNEKVINAELLACLQRFFPTEDERQLLQSFGGPVAKLGKAEQFFCQMLQVPQMQERIDMFLYKLEFARNHRSLSSKIQIVKRACRDLVENFSFLQALEEVKREKGRPCWRILAQDQPNMSATAYVMCASSFMKPSRTSRSKCSKTTRQCSHVTTCPESTKSSARFEMTCREPCTSSSWICRSSLTA